MFLFQSLLTECIFCITVTLKSPSPDWCPVASTSPIRSADLSFAGPEVVQVYEQRGPSGLIQAKLGWKELLLAMISQNWVTVFRINFSTPSFCSEAEKKYISYSKQFLWHFWYTQINTKGFDHTLRVWSSCCHLNKCLSIDTTQKGNLAWECTSRLAASHKAMHFPGQVWNATADWKPPSLQLAEQELSVLSIL